MTTHYVVPVTTGKTTSLKYNYDKGDEQGLNQIIIVKDSDRKELYADHKPISPLRSKYVARRVVTLTEVITFHGSVTYDKVYVDDFLSFSGPKPSLSKIEKINKLLDFLGRYAKEVEIYSTPCIRFDLATYLLAKLHPMGIETEFPKNITEKRHKLMELNNKMGEIIDSLLTGFHSKIGTVKLVEDPLQMSCGIELEANYKKSLERVLSYEENMTQVAGQFIKAD